MGWLMILVKFSQKIIEFLCHLVRIVWIHIIFQSLILTNPFREPCSTSPLATSRPLEAESTVQRISAVRPLFRAAAAGTATMPEVAAKSMTGGWRV